MADTQESFICPVCLDIFKTPKLLPCFHTFCEHCLNDVSTRHPGGTFPCPSCRTMTTVPPGGVSVFQTNFYIKSEDLERVRSNIMCLQHPQHDRDLFCVECDLPICLKCKLTKHEGHKTQDLKEAAPRARDQLDDDKSRLTRCASDVKKHVELAAQEQQAVKDKHSALVTHIRNRQTTIKAAVDKYTDDALASLDKVTDEITNTLEVNLHCLLQNLQELTELQQQVQQTLDSGADFKLVTVAKEMRCGRGSEEAVEKLKTKQVMAIRRPVLRSSTRHDTTLQCIRDYMGSAAKMEMDMPEREETMVERFRCREDPDTDVCQLCPMTNDDVWISYEPYVLRNDACSERFNAAGKVVDTIKCDTPGKNTMVRKRNSTIMYKQPTSGLVSTYAKRCDSDMIRYFRLDNCLSGQATVYITTIVSDDPWKTKNKKVITLNCDAHRAFDVQDDEQLFVVLEEGKTPDFQRRVQLYRHNEPDAIDTYSSPVTPFQPSDVCFYKKDDNEVLLVADELNDAIHVVNVCLDSLTFTRYLFPGCPLLVQPTALNTDTEHRLWIACRGGIIFTCAPSISRMSYFTNIAAVLDRVMCGVRVGWGHE